MGDASRHINRGPGVLGCAFKYWTRAATGQRLVSVLPTYMSAPLPNVSFFAFWMFIRINDGVERELMAISESKRG